MTTLFAKSSGTAALLLLLALSPAFAQVNGAGKIQGTNAGIIHHFPHPLNATMGIPDPVGSYNIRLNGFREVKDGDGRYDVSGHLSYGMFEWGGIHLRSLGVRTTPFTEIIGMVGLWRNDRCSQGISLLGIVGVPTGKKNGKAHHGLSYLAGLTGRIAAPGVITNDIILHYDFTAKHYIAETGSVLKLWPNLFVTLDARGAFGNARPDISILSSMKFQMWPAVFLALGYHTPVTNAKTFTHQIFAQLEIGSH
jgi:hypothetical protein